MQHLHLKTPQEGKMEVPVLRRGPHHCKRGLELPRMTEAIPSPTKGNPRTKDECDEHAEAYDRKVGTIQEINKELGKTLVCVLGRVERTRPPQPTDSSEKETSVNSVCSLISEYSLKPSLRWAG